MFVKITIFDGYRGLFHIFVDLFTVHDELVITISLIFPEEIVITIIIFRDCRLDALCEFTWSNGVKVFTVISEQTTDS